MRNRLIDNSSQREIWDSLPTAARDFAVVFSRIEDLREADVIEGGIYAVTQEWAEFLRDVRDDHPMTNERIREVSDIIQAMAAAQV